MSYFSSRDLIISALPKQSRSVVLALLDPTCSVFQTPWPAALSPGLILMMNTYQFQPSCFEMCDLVCTRHINLDYPITCCFKSELTAHSTWRDTIFSPRFLGTRLTRSCSCRVWRIINEVYTACHGEYSRMKIALYFWRSGFMVYTYAPKVQNSLDHSAQIYPALLNIQSKKLEPYWRLNP